MAQEPPITAQDTQPRACPSCGAKVSSRAKTCLSCGADLQAPPEPPPVEPPAPAAPTERKWSPRNILIQVLMTVLGLALLVGIVWGFMTLVNRASTPDPSATPTLESTPTTEPTPGPSNTPAPTPTPLLTVTPIPPRQHTVKAGETLSTIADFYDTTVDALLAINNMSEGDILQVGQVLIIPGEAGPPQPGPNSGTIIHVVQAGETLLGIAQEYGVSMRTIQQLNDIQNAEDIQIGQQLVIPVGPTATPTQGPSPTPTPLAKYSPPALLSPLDAATFEGDETPILLQWAAVALLRSSEWYAVTLERPGSEQSPEEFRTKTTALYVPVELYPAPNDNQRLFKWSVRVVRQIDDPQGSNSIPTYEDFSLPGQVRSFMWIEPPLKPTLTPGPTP